MTWEVESGTVTYVGALCKRGHNYRGTGKSLRYRTYRACIECQKVRDKDPWRAARKFRSAKRFPCFIYFLFSDGAIKIGGTRSPSSRIFAFRKPRLLFAMRGDNYGEKALHEFARTTFVPLNDRSRIGWQEWYRVTPELLTWIDLVPEWERYYLSAGREFVSILVPESRGY